MKNMEGQTIVKALDLGTGYTLLKFSDGEIGLVQIITPDGLAEDLAEFLAEDKPAKTTKEKTKETKKELAGKETKKEEPTEEEEEYTWKDLQEMDYDELKALVKDNKLDTNPKEFDEDEDDEVEEFRKSIAKEIGVEVPGKSKKDSDKKPKKKEEEEEDPEDDGYTWEELEEMDEEELKDLCDEENLDTDPDDYEDEEDKLRKAIAKELKIEIPKKK